MYLASSFCYYPHEPSESARRNHMFLNCSSEWIFFYPTHLVNSSGAPNEN